MSDAAQQGEPVFHDEAKAIAWGAGVLWFIGVIVLSIAAVVVLGGSWRGLLPQPALWGAWVLATAAGWKLARNEDSPIRGEAMFLVGALALSGIAFNVYAFNEGLASPSTLSGFTDGEGAAESDEDEPTVNKSATNFDERFDRELCERWAAWALSDAANALSDTEYGHAVIIRYADNAKTQKFRTAFREEGHNYIGGDKGAWTAINDMC